MNEPDEPTEWWLRDAMEQQRKRQEERESAHDVVRAKMTEQTNAPRPYRVWLMNACRWIGALPAATAAGTVIFYAVFLVMRNVALNNALPIGFGDTPGALTKALIWVAAFCAYTAGGAAFILVARWVVPAHKNRIATALCGVLLFVAGGFTVIIIQWREFAAFFPVASILIGALGAAIDGRLRDDD